jgi:hypothetical protein
VPSSSETTPPPQCFITELSNDLTGDSIGFLASLPDYLVVGLVPKPEYANYIVLSRLKSSFFLSISSCSVLKTGRVGTGMELFFLWSRSVSSGFDLDDMFSVRSSSVYSERDSSRRKTSSGVPSWAMKSRAFS